MNPKENDNEIIELTDEELDQIFADDDFDNGEEDGEIRSFYFSNPDPYAKVKPRPDDAPKREFSFDEKGNIVVKNPSAFWLPDVKIVEEHGGSIVAENLPDGGACITVRLPATQKTRELQADARQRRAGERR